MRKGLWAFFPDYALRVLIGWAGKLRAAETGEEAKADPRSAAKHHEKERAKISNRGGFKTICRKT